MQQVEWLIKHCECRPCGETIVLPDGSERKCTFTHHETRKKQHMRLKHPPLAQ